MPFASRNIAARLHIGIAVGVDSNSLTAVVAKVEAAMVAVGQEVGLGEACNCNEALNDVL